MKCDNTVLALSLGRHNNTNIYFCSRDASCARAPRTVLAHQAGQRAAVSPPPAAARAPPAYLRFEHPITGMKVSFEAPMWGDLQRAVDLLRKKSLKQVLEATGVDFGD